MDHGFSRISAKLNDTFWKLTRVAAMFEIARPQAEQSLTSPLSDLQEFATSEQALEDMPIHLDSALAYLRILADCLADVTPYLYGTPGKIIRKRSFRRQRDWYLKTRPDFDAEYTEILRTYTDWFDILAGKGPREGLRDKVVHHHGMFQVHFRHDDGVGDAQVIAGILDKYRWVCDNAIPMIKDITSGLFRFLDHYVTHFNHRIGEATGKSPLDLSDPHHTEGFQFEAPLQFFWLFPDVDRSIAADA